MRAPATAYEADVRCNLCGSKAHDAVSHNAEWNCTLVRCEGCGLMFYSPRLREDYTVPTFLKGGDAKAEAESMADRGVFFGETQGTAEEQIATLKGYFSHIFLEHLRHFAAVNGDRPARSMFEVGTSVGWYMVTAREIAARDGVALSTAGCDANIFAAEVARERFGLDVRGEVFSDYPETADRLGRYDLLHAFDYIEHSYTPADDLAKMFHFAAPGAVLALKTFLHEHDHAGSYAHPVFHHHHFTADTLRAAIEKAGWRILVFDDERERVYAQVTVFATRDQAG
ncbi:methyltransferase domain-containing protein [Dankookia rubra]|nr:methyltransferase domain-containing protein [Dankookia rubra]